jgi:hypothetical protein
VKPRANKFGLNGVNIRRMRDCRNTRKNWLAKSIPKMVTIRNGES